MTPNERVAEAARALCGSSFRWHGRAPETGLDCVGLAVAAFASAGVTLRPPTGYRLGSGMVEQVTAVVAGSGLALASIERADAERETRSLSLDWSRLPIAPGATVVVGDDTTRWRVRGWVVEQMMLKLDLVRIAPGAVPIPADAGRALPTPDRVAGRTHVALVELPPVDGVRDAPDLFVAACGTGSGWRSALLSASIDGGASWTSAGRTAMPAVMGRITQVPGAAPATLPDLRNIVEVTLFDPAAMLADADFVALDAGVNLAMVGDELLQFGRAEPLGQGRWRLSMLWRGRRGSEFAIGLQKVGDPFVLIERDALAPLEGLALNAGSLVRVEASGLGDDIAATAEHLVSGWAIMPPSPVHLEVENTNAGNMLRWVRRSRDGWAWRDHVDAPTGADGALYRLRLEAADGLVVESDAIDAQAVAGPDVLSAEVRQMGVHGPSRPAIFDI